MAIFYGTNFGDAIIDEVPRVKWKDAFETSKASIEQNIPPIGTQEFDNVVANIQKLAKTVLVPLKAKYGDLLDGRWINSWYRNKEVNEKVGGAENSNHMTGLAMDLTYPTQIFSRTENETLFYYILDYFTQNSVLYDELIWEAYDSEFLKSGKAEVFPQWVHVALKESGGRRRISSQGVVKDFSQDRVEDGYTNVGATNLVKVEKGSFLSYFIYLNSGLSAYQPLASFDFRAKFTLAASTLFSISGTQADFVSSKNRTHYFEGGIMRWKGLDLGKIIAMGDVNLAFSYENMIRSGRYSEIMSKRNDLGYLESISKALRKKQAVEAQLKLIGKILDETFVRGQAFSLREPICYAFMADAVSYDPSASSRFIPKSDSYGITTDGSWLDYHSKLIDGIDPSVQIKYGKIIERYFERK